MKQQKTMADKLSKGENTRIFLVEKTIDLVARSRTLEAATLKTIAEASQMATSTITYHFKNRKRLLECVLDYIASKGDLTPVGDYLADYQDMFESQESQSFFITGLLNHFNRFFRDLSRQEMDYCMVYTLLWDVAELRTGKRANLPRTRFDNDREALREICKRIAGKKYTEEVYLWNLMTLESLAKMIFRNKMNDDFCAVSPKFNARFLYFCNHQIQLGLGLIPDKKEDE